jgi:hypothetical protein
MIPSEGSFVIRLGGPVKVLPDTFADLDPPDKSSSKKVAAKLSILQAAVATTFFRPCLGGAQSIAYRNVAMGQLQPISGSEGATI